MSPLSLDSIPGIWEREGLCNCDEQETLTTHKCGPPTLLLAQHKSPPYFISQDGLGCAAITTLNSQRLNTTTKCTSHSHFIFSWGWQGSLAHHSPSGTYSSQRDHVDSCLPGCHGGGGAVTLSLPFKALTQRKYSSLAHISFTKEVPWPHLT